MWRGSQSSLPRTFGVHDEKFSFWPFIPLPSYSLQRRGQSHWSSFLNEFSFTLLLHPHQWELMAVPRSSLEMASPLDFHSKLVSSSIVSMFIKLMFGPLLTLLLISWSKLMQGTELLFTPLPQDLTKETDSPGFIPGEAVDSSEA